MEGVDIGTGELGPLSSGKLSSGRTFTSSDASSDVAMVDASYATQHKLKAGSTIAIGNSKGTSTNFKVIGIVSEPAGNNPSDVYIPLAVAQNLAGLKNKVNTIYVAASSAAAIGSVQSRGQEGPAVRDRDHLGRPGQRGHRLAVQRLQPGQQPGQVARAGRPDRGVRPGQPADDGGGLAPGA